MIKGQFHEEFKTFSDAGLERATTAAEIFCAGVAAKSLSVVFFQGLFYVGIGYRTDEAAYPVEIHALSIEHPQRVSLDEQLAECEENINADVICHALYVGPERGLMVAVMVHG